MRTTSINNLPFEILQRIYTEVKVHHFTNSSGGLSNSGNCLAAANKVFWAIKTSASRSISIPPHQEITQNFGSKYPKIKRVVFLSPTLSNIQSLKKCDLLARDDWTVQIADCWELTRGEFLNASKDGPWQNQKITAFLTVLIKLRIPSNFRKIFSEDNKFIELLESITSRTKCDLKTISLGVRTDRELIKLIAKKAGLGCEALRNADISLKHDIRFLTEMGSISRANLKFATIKAKTSSMFYPMLLEGPFRNTLRDTNGNIEICRELIRCNWRFIAGESTYRDIAMFRKIEENPLNVVLADESLSRNPDFIKAAINVDWRVFLHIPSEHRNNIEIAMCAVRKNEQAMNFVGSELASLLRFLGIKKIVDAPALPSPGHLPNAQ